MPGIMKSLPVATSPSQTSLDQFKALYAADPEAARRRLAEEAAWTIHTRPDLKGPIMQLVEEIGS